MAKSFESKTIFYILQRRKLLLGEFASQAGTTKPAKDIRCRLGLPGVRSQIQGIRCLDHQVFT